MLFWRTLTSGLFHGDDGHVRLQDGGEEVLLGRNFLADEMHVVVYVAQIWLEIRLIDIALDASQDGEQRMDRAIEVRDLAAQIIDPFGRCDRAGEDGALDLFDVGFEVGDDGAIALDHLVQDCPEHRVSAKCKQFGVLFEPRARAVQLTRDTLSNRDDETRSDEDADLAEIDLAAVMVVAGGAQDDQLHPAFVFFDLRAQVKALGVLDGKLVQTERIP